ncbi:MAG TPA: hypothetical protein VF541_12995 [Longimicrobium sp.]|jgi:hypothetical protein
MIGTGIYTPAEAAALLKAPSDEVRRWAFGYARRRNGARVDYQPLIRPKLPEIDGERALTFLELVELMFIKGFRQAGVSWHAIHEAARVAAKLFQTEHPFAMRQFFADPRGVYALLRDSDEGESLVTLAGSGQQVFDTLVRPYLGQLEFDPLEVPTRWWPMGKEGRVVVDPAVSFGQPMVAEAGIPTRALAEALEAEQEYGAERALDRVSWLFKVPPRHVQTAVRFEEWLRAA